MNKAKLKKNLVKSVAIALICTGATAVVYTPPAEAGWGKFGKILGDVIGALGGDSSSSSSSSSSSGIDVRKLSQQKHAVQNPNDTEELLMLAVKNNDVETVKSLLANNKIDVNGVYNTKQVYHGGDGITLFQAALKHDYRDIMQALLENGADVRGYYEFDNEYVSYLTYVAYNHNNYNNALDLIQYLHNWGASIDSQNGYNNALTSLIKGTSYGYSQAVNIAKYLLDEGIDVDYKTKSGDTALIMATDYVWYDMIDLLAANGANLRARDAKGRDVLQIALDKQNLQLYKHMQDVLARGQQPSHSNKAKAHSSSASSTAAAGNGKKISSVKARYELDAGQYSSLVVYGNKILKAFNQSDMSDPEAVKAGKNTFLEHAEQWKDFEASLSKVDPLAGASGYSDAEKKTISETYAHLKASAQVSQRFFRLLAKETYTDQDKEDAMQAQKELTALSSKLVKDDAKMTKMR